MTIQEIVTLVEAKLNTLTTSYNLATSAGDLEEVIRIDAEMQETHQTIERLKQLL